MTDFSEEMCAIRENFFNTSLADMQPEKLIPLDEVILKALTAIEETAKIL